MGDNLEGDSTRKYLRVNEGLYPVYDAGNHSLDPGHMSVCCIFHSISLHIWNNKILEKR